MLLSVKFSVPQAHSDTTDQTLQLYIANHTHYHSHHPDKWFSNVEVAAGKIVGRETVQYVANIYKYYIAYKLSRNMKNMNTL